MKAKDEYKKLEKKYSLPSFEKINHDFEISDTEKTEFLLREIRRKIVDKCDLYAKVLVGLLQPDAVVSDMHEIEILKEEDKEGLFNLYKRLMFFNRFSIETSINENDGKTSEFINAFFKEWPELKEQFLVFVKKLKEVWLKDMNVKDDVRYLG